MEKLMIPEILDTIKVLTVEELMELVKACEKEFDVSATANIVVQKDPFPPVVPQTEFDVELTAFGPQKIKVIKAVHEVTGLGLKEAKTLVDSAPKTIKEGVSIEEAKALKAKLEELGATITVK